MMLFVYSKFKGKKWLKLSPEKRLKVLIALEKKIAWNLELERPLRLEIYEKSDTWNCFGAFKTEFGTKRIVLNSCLIYDPKFRFHAIETIAHESRHAYQFELISRKLRWYEFREKRWQRNWRGYITSGEDELMYNNQSIERDAQKYSIKILKKHKYNDEDYKITLQNVVYRYENADNQARKQYGAFYKRKIEKNIKANTRF